MRTHIQHFSAVFPGVGCQWVGMAEQISKNEPAFRNELALWSTVLEKDLGWSVASVVTDSKSKDFLERTEYLIPSITVTQLALWRLLQSKGIAVDAVIGHSIGEIAAAYAAGILGVEDTAALIVERSRLEHSRNSDGGMVVVGLDETQARVVVRDYVGLEVAGVNGPRETIVSGPLSQLCAFEDFCRRHDFFVRRANVPAAYHSAQCDEISAQLSVRLAHLRPTASMIGFYSTVEGRRLTGSELDAEYWRRNVRQPVNFYQAFNQMLSDGHTKFIEVAPHPVLTHSMVSCGNFRNKPLIIIPTLKRHEGTLSFEQEFSLLTADGIGQPDASLNERAHATDAAFPVTRLPSTFSFKFAVDLIEQKIKRIKSLAQSESIDQHATFWEVGLSSVDLTELASAVSRESNIRVDPIDCFNYPSIEALAHFLESNGASTAEKASSSHCRNRNDRSASIVGAACRLPGGVHSLDTFWELLVQGRSGIKNIPEERWQYQDFHDDHPDMPGKINSRKAGVVDDIDSFDAGFFGISPTEAIRMDPQQRLLLHTVWHALEDAGINPHTLENSNTGVFVGAMNTNDYLARKESMVQAQAWRTPYDSIGVANSALAGRVAYFFGLMGPAMTIDTACSSSLVALHQAVKAVENGECTLAIVAGVNLLMSPWPSVAFSHSGMLSPDGVCKTFSDDANGYVRGEGCCVVVICNQASALEQGWRIHANIMGSAVNQNGRTSGLTAPNGIAQEKVIRDALTRAGVAPTEVGYVEGHGTGTPLGDPIEMRALNQVMCAEDNRLQWYVGSVKTNIGHLEAAAGMAGLFKSMLMLKKGLIPPHLNLTHLNRNIELKAQIAQDTVPWPSGYTRRICGVSSFGFTGSNAHAVLGEVLPGAAPAPQVKGPQCYLLPLSARTEESFKALVWRYVSNLVRGDTSDLGADELASICRVAQKGRAHFAWREIVCADSAEQLVDDLRHLHDELANGGKVSKKTRSQPKIAFLFSGQGAHYQDMGRQLYETYPAFCTVFDRCAAIAQAHGLTLKSWERGETGSGLGNTELAQPTIYALQVSLLAVLAEWGIVPDMVLGHSLGEYAAAYAAGSFSLEAGMKLVCTRARLMAQMTQGAMLEAKISPQEFHAATSNLLEVDLAAINGPNRIVLAGECAAIHAWQEHLEQNNIACRRLPVSHAFHSQMMEPMLPAFREQIGTIALQRPTLTFISSVTGTDIMAAPAGAAALSDVQYWLNNIRQPVLFASALETLEAMEPDIVLEIGPRAALLGIAKNLRHPIKQPTLNGDGAEVKSLTAALAALYRAGANIDWQTFDAAPLADGLDRTPNYSFANQRYWIPFESHRDTPPALDEIVARPELSEPSTLTVDLCHMRPIISDHRIYGVPVVPGALLISAIMNTLRHHLPPDHGWERARLGVKKIVFSMPFSLPATSQPQALLTFDPSEQNLQCAMIGEDLPCVIAELEGHVDGEQTESIAHEHADLGRPSRAWSGKELREAWASRGLFLGQNLASVRNLKQHGDEMIAELEYTITATSDIPSANGSVDPDFVRIGVLLDAVLQCAGAFAWTDQQELWLPREIKGLTCTLDMPQRLWARGRLLTRDGERCWSAWSLHDASGQVVMTVGELQLVRTQPDSLVRSVFRHGLTLAAPGWRWVAPLPELHQIGKQAIPTLTATLAGPASLLKQDIAAYCGTGSAAGGDADCLFIVSAYHDSDSVDEAYALLEKLAQQAGQVAASASGAKLFIVLNSLNRALTEAVKGFARALALEEPSAFGGLLELAPNIELPAILAQIGHMLRQSPRQCLRLTSDGVFEQQLNTLDFGPRPHVIKLSDRIYVVSGGLGKIGLSLAGWLADHGCRRLLLLSRRSPSSAVAAKLQRLRATGCVVEVIACNVSDFTSLQQALRPYAGEIGGVLHCAGVLEDGLLATQTEAARAKVYAPKLRGLHNLHKLTLDEQLSHFIVCSSIAAHFGAIGQTTYAAANAFAEGFVAQRRLEGLPGLSIAWPAWIGGGMAVENDSGGIRYWESRGFTAIDEVLAQYFFAQVLEHEHANLVIDTRSSQPSMAERQAEAGLAGDSENVTDIFMALRSELVAFGLEQINDLPLDRSFREIGLDSFDLLEMRDRLSAQGFQVSSQTILSAVSIGEFCRSLSAPSQKSLTTVEGAGSAKADPRGNSVLSRRVSTVANHTKAQDRSASASAMAILGEIRSVLDNELDYDEIQSRSLLDLGLDSFKLIELASKLASIGLKVPTRVLMANTPVSSLVASFISATPQSHVAHTNPVTMPQTSLFGSQLDTAADGAMRQGWMRKSWPEVEALASKFICGGWETERYRVESISVSGSQAQAKFGAEVYNMPADGVFHLPLFYAFLWVDILVEQFVAHHWPGQVHKIREVQINLPARITTISDIRASLNLTRLGKQCQANFFMSGDNEWNGQVSFDVLNYVPIELKPDQLLLEQEGSQAVLDRMMQLCLGNNFVLDQFEFLPDKMKVESPPLVDPARFPLFNWTRCGSQMALIYAYHRLGLSRKPENESYVISAKINMVQGDERSDRHYMSFTSEKEIIHADVLYLNGTFWSNHGVSFSLRVTAPSFEFKSASQINQPSLREGNELFETP